jgi:putative ABC transport system permease protein
MKLVITGVATGLVVASVLTRLMGALLFGVSPFDPFTFGGVTVLMFVAFAACCMPALRATRVDPMVALRYK